MPEYEPIHKAEYLQDMDALVKSKKRCSIELPPEPEWVLTSKRCVPTRKEACAFETVDVQNFEKKSVARD